MGDYVYVATDSGLMYVGFGDSVRGVTVWGSPSGNNGSGMIHWQGSLYIPAQESIMRWDGSNMLPMGLDLGEGLPPDKQGNVAALASTNNWLIAGVNSRSATDSATIWGYNGQGWHNMAVLPPGMPISCLYYRRSNQRLYAGGAGLIFSLYLPDIAHVVDTTSPEFAPVGWLETDWFYGGLQEVRKDMESVYILGEDISANQSVDVYWQDDDSTGWELLGTVTGNRTELRWSDYATRPNTRQIRLGLLLHTNDSTLTPIIRAVRVKFHSMIADWFRFRLPLQVSDDQAMLDNDLNPYNAKQQLTHLLALSTQVAPIIIEDLLGVQYEAKVLDASFQIDKAEYINSEKRVSGTFHLTVEQVTQGAYAEA